MKNILSLTLTFSFLLITSITMHAQERDWEIISPEFEEFSVQIPIETLSAFKISLGKGKYTTGSYQSKLNGTYYLISSANYSDWGLIEATKRYAKKNNAESEKVRFGYIEGTVYKFVDSGNYTNKIIIASTKKRSYVFHLTGVKPDPSLVKKFVGSIRFKPSAKRGKTTRKKRFANYFDSESLDLVSYKTKKQPSTISNREDKKSNRGGIGTGTGFGTGPGRLKPPSTKKPVTKPVKRTGIRITAKPRPGYTYLARRYGIKGVVRVRVTFLANGRIGGVSVVTGLPFGLTANAIRAAQRMTFSPPTRNGVPYSVNKTVQYSFRIY